MPKPPSIPSIQNRKKWTDEEERSLINKYAEMQSSGILAGDLSREKKFRPIAAHVNSSHHAKDPLSYPFVRSSKDASTKVQNMRHRYLLVKRKLLLSSSADQLDWSSGLSLWPNFLLYRDVFGDAPLPPEDPLPPPPRETPRRERKRRGRREEEEREWEEGVERRREEWKRRMDGMMERHREEMERIRARLLQEQQAVVNQLVGIVSHFGEVGDAAAISGGLCLSRMMNGVATGENRVGGDGVDDQFVVDDE